MFSPQKNDGLVGLDMFISLIQSFYNIDQNITLYTITRHIVICQLNKKELSINIWVLKSYLAKTSFP